VQLVFFRLHLVLHACAARFDVTGTAQNFLESKQALRRRMHLDDYHCVLCQQSSKETIMHLLFYCPFARDCWGILIF